jgi:hypothetical protein
MRAALGAEMDPRLAAEAARTGGRGSRSGRNGRNGYRPKEVMTEVGPITVQISRDRLGTFTPAAEQEPVLAAGQDEDHVLGVASGIVGHGVSGSGAGHGGAVVDEADQGAAVRVEGGVGGEFGRAETGAVDEGVGPVLGEQLFFLFARGAGDAPGD